MRFDCLRLGRDRCEVGAALRELCFQGSQGLPDLALLTFERAQPLMLPRLLLLHLRQPIGERAGIVRVRRHGGDEEQQRHQGPDELPQKLGWHVPRPSRRPAGGRPNYAGGAPAEPGMPGSRRGVKAASLNGAGAPFGAFSFFFFLTSRLPRSRDFAMDPASQT